MPPGAAIYRELGSDNAWTDTEHLLAGVLYVLQQANYQRGGNKGTAPVPVQTPASAAKQQRAIRGAKAAADRANRRLEQEGT